MVESRTRFGAIDLLLLALLMGVGIITLHRISTGLQYEWQWGVIPGYVMRIDESGSLRPNMIMQGFLATIRLSIWSMLLAMVVGTLMAVARTEKRMFWRLVGRSYVELFRNLPPLVLVFIFYFFIGSQLVSVLGIDQALDRVSSSTSAWLTLLFAPPDQLSSFLIGVVTLGVYEGAYIAEILRGGIQSIDDGQWQAAKALGLSRSQQLQHIILPQAFHRSWPPLAGQFVSTIKDSAIVSVISIQELTFQGMELMAATYLTFEIWITITLLYFVLTYSCSLVVRRLELKQLERA